VLIDLRMPRLAGVGAIQAIRAVDPGARLVALTPYEGDADIHRALSAGACGYLLKDALVAELVNAVRTAAAGKRVHPSLRFCQGWPNFGPDRVTRAVVSHTPNSLNTLAEGVGFEPTRPLRA
jgi:DNA-binding NarL/FixJ family response regulator